MGFIPERLLMMMMIVSMTRPLNNQFAPTSSFLDPVIVIELLLIPLGGSAQWCV